MGAGPRSGGAARPRIAGRPKSPAVAMIWLLRAAYIFGNRFHQGFNTLSRTSITSLMPAKYSPGQELSFIERYRVRRMILRRQDS